MFYAYRTDSASVQGHTYKELQLHQFVGKSARDHWCELNSARPVRVSEIPAHHMHTFRQFGKTRRPDGGFWAVVDSGTN